ncbi:MAG: ATP-binding cassette domain-containing protein [Bacteroidota bacterium]|nr:ATP-binding cassette domain-containing protein [Bacteroidota bacterium]
MLLELKRVSKEFQNVKAVDEVSFTVPHGRILGLLGPNGAGKTSLIRIITGITRADSGQVLMDGKDLTDITDPSIGYMPEERGLYKKMKVGEQLVYLCRLKGSSAQDALQKVNYWMEKFEIQNWWNKKVDELSKGMSQKIQFIATIAHNPKLIILDEPFSGLDPINSNLIKDEIKNLKDQGASILFSTHRMEQVEEMCEEIVLINKGKIILGGAVQEIRERFKEDKYELMTSSEIPNELSIPADTISRNEHQTILKLHAGASSNDVLNALIRSNIQIKSFREILPSFNEIFIRSVNEVNHE